MSVTIERQASRLYFQGNTYPIKDQIKAMGGHWDGDRRAWWVGVAKNDEATSLVERLGTANTATATAERPKVDRNSRVVAKAEYKGRKYYVLWMGTCKSGERKARLTVLDGSIDFWADLSACNILKEYSPREYRGRTEYTTLGSISRFIENQKESRRNGEEQCASCGKYGSLHHDLEDGLMKCYGCCDIPA